MRASSSDTVQCQRSPLPARPAEAHRHTLVDIDVHETEYHVDDLAGEPLALIPRTSGKEVTRTKGYGVRGHPRL
jgi:hypothetical protein